MKHVKSFPLFENHSLSPEQIDFLDRCIVGKWEFDPSTGLVNSTGSFIYKNHGLKDFKGIRFGKIEADFDFAFNQLTSLDGSPREVGGIFRFVYNHITSLEGGPEIVYGKFACYSNPLVSLKGAPKFIGGVFDSSEFLLSGREWNLEGWMKILKNGNERAKSLILSLIGPESLNQEIEKDPESTMMELRKVWNSPDFAEIKKEIKIPDRYKEEMGTLGDLNDLGF
jgi:hypothetical protein